ncbi:MAG: winged helix-turn-helix transcriptional regulator [Candidatus Lokiarchaeota archaeon]|nr:winged helix-turn-helix transcriptional regulator [Candidatus Lokiarchaeota archaeon]
MTKFNKKLFVLLVALSSGILMGIPNQSKANGGPPYNITIQPNNYFNITYSYDYSPFDLVFNFNLSTNVYTDLSLDFNLTYPLLTSRQIYLEINANEDVEIEFKGLFDIEGFIEDLPENPTFEDIILGFNYNSFYRIKSNTTISELKFRFIKSPLFGFQGDNNYSIGFYKGNLNGNPELILTTEREGAGIEYLEGEIENFEEESDYYISVYEIETNPINPPNYFWIWIIVPIILGFIAIIIVMTKKDYIERMKRRNVNIDKGSHRLDIEEVLENENRSKIIDLILEEPGIHFNELLRKTELAPGNLVWHLDILETYKVIKKKRVGNYVMFIPYYNKNPLSNINLKLQKSELTLQILESIEENPGIWNSKLTDEMEIHRKTIQYHIDKLIDLGLIYKKKEGSKKKIYPNLKADYYEDKTIKD